MRFDVLQIDYGAYVDLLKTSRAPSTLFGQAGEGETDDNWSYEALFGGVHVPEDDYRAIRRAIVRLPGDAYKAIEYRPA